MRKHLGIVAIVIALFAAGCTSGSDSGAKSTGTTVASGPAPGVTADAIKIGITYVDLEAIKDLTNINHGSYEDAYRAVIADINANGGINGRKLEPVFAPVNPIGTVPAEEACVKLTQDEKVFAVLGFFQADAPLCYVETHKTAVIGGTMTKERLARAAAPWFTTDPGEDLETDVVKAFAKNGTLDGKLAVFANTQDADLLNKTVLPLLKTLGVHPVANAVLDAPPDDVAAQNQAVNVIAERFKSSGANKVLIIGGGGINWANAMEKSPYRPKLVFTGTNSIAAFYNDSASRDLSLLQGAVAGGLYGPAQAVYDEPAMSKCLAVQKKAGVKLTPPDDVPEGKPAQYVSSFAACRTLALFRAIAEKAGKTLNYGTFDQAGTSLGAVHIPGDPTSFHFGPTPARDGNPAVTTYVWDPAKKDFVAK